MFFRIKSKVSHLASWPPTTLSLLFHPTGSLHTFFPQPEWAPLLLFLAHDGLFLDLSQSHVLLSLGLSEVSHMCSHRALSFPYCDTFPFSLLWTPLGSSLCKRDCNLVHCSSFSTYSCVWHMVGVRSIFIDWTKEWTRERVKAFHLSPTRLLPATGLHASLETLLSSTLSSCSPCFRNLIQNPAIPQILPTTPTWSRFFLCLESYILYNTFSPDLVFANATQAHIIRGSTL